MIVFPMTNSLSIGKEIAKKAKAKLGTLKSELFPDGEFHLRFMDEVKGKEVVLVQSLHPNPNDSLLELVFAGRTAKELGASRVIAVIPYLAYMRQDMRFKSGECVSNEQIAWLINSSADLLVTVDPHIHRIKDLSDIFHIGRKKLSANKSIAEYVKKKFRAKNSIIAGPDIESSQWAKSIADSIGFESVIFLKERFTSRKVRINVTEEKEWKGKDVIIIDDIISSGHTMIEAVKEIKKRKPKSIQCICVHAIFAEKAYEKLKKAGAKTIISTNAIEHKSNGIDLSKLIAEEL